VDQRESTRLRDGCHHRQCCCNANKHHISHLGACCLDENLVLQVYVSLQCGKDALIPVDCVHYIITIAERVCNTRVASCNESHSRLFQSRISLVTIALITKNRMAQSRGKANGCQLSTTPSASTITCPTVALDCLPLTSLPTPIGPLISAKIIKFGAVLPMF
jgi:hypothetical protein